MSGYYKRGIPSVSDYAHWNEDAELMWYQENRYDMEYADFMEYDYDEFDEMNYGPDVDDPDFDFDDIDDFDPYE